MSGKLLMFAKLSLKIFIYYLSEIFCFSTKEIIDIYKKYLIEKFVVFHILTDTDSTGSLFLFLTRTVIYLKKKFRVVIFEVITASKIYKRYDTSHKFWDISGSRKESKTKKPGYFEIGNIDNPCLVTLTINPKEYLEILKNFALNKKHKEIEKESSRTGF